MRWTPGATTPTSVRWWWPRTSSTSGWPQLGEELTADYEGRPPLLVGVLKGAFVFMSDLARAIRLPVEIDVMAVASYGSATTTSGVVRIVKDLDSDLTGRHVLVVEDIVDSGLTLSYLRRSLMAREPASLEVCALLVKEGRQPWQARPALRRVPHPARFRGRLRPRRGRALPQSARRARLQGPGPRRVTRPRPAVVATGRPPTMPDDQLCRSHMQGEGDAP